MSKPLRVGIAGLGVVGAALVALLRRQRGALERRTGRDVVVSAVSARSARDRDIDLAGVPFFEDPVALAATGPISLSN